MKRHTRITALAAGTLALAAFAATPAMSAGMFDTWDADQSGDINNSEFDKGLNGLKIYDAREKAPQDDDEVTLEMFDQRIGNPDWRTDETYQAWDADRDTVLKESEFRDGYYDTYDADGDGMIDENEFSLFEDDANEQGWFE